MSQRSFARLLRRVLFGGRAHSYLPADLAMTLLRVFAGLSLSLAHGYGKLPPSQDFINGVGQLGFPQPTIFAWAAALAEFGGGMLLALGLATRPAAFFVLCTMSTAAFLQHADDPYGRKEMALLYAAIAVVYLVAGSGRVSIDRYLR